MGRPGDGSPHLWFGVDRPAMASFSPGCIRKADDPALMAAIPAGIGGISAFFSPGLPQPWEPDDASFER